MDAYVDHVDRANDLRSSTPELIDFRYGIHRNSVVVWVRFRGPFVLHRLDHGRFHAFLLMLFRHDHYHSHSHNLLLLRLLGY